MFFDVVTILHGFFISLGVGASTVAAVNFCVAIADGKIDANERRMMGLSYIVLRIAMLFIMLTIFILTLASETTGSYMVMVWLLLTVLFANAFFMTFLKMPSAFGPAIQVAAWYTLGILSVLRLVNWETSFLQFLMFYLLLALLSITAINLYIIYVKEKVLAK